MDTRVYSYNNEEYFNASKFTKGKVKIHDLINFTKYPDDSIKVSIIVPVYNVEEFLPECLDSCINQTLQDIEIICVNDGSTDNSLKILHEYANKDYRIKIIDKDNAGYGHTINIGIDMASGEYIGIVESDDFVNLDMYEELYNIAFKNKLDVIKADFYRFSKDNGKINKRLDRVAARAPDLYNKIVNPKNDSRIFHLVMQTWSGIYNRRYLISNNIRHNETPGASYQDNGFWFQSLMFADKVYFYDKAFYMNRRDNPNSSVYNKGKVYCMHEEYEYIKDILNENPELYDLYKYQYSRKKFLNFLFTYNRIGDEFKWEYAFSIQKELKKAIKLDEINWDEFDTKDKENLELILENPKNFILKDIKKNILKEPNDKIKNYEKDIQNLKKQIKSLNNEKKIVLSDNKRLNYQLRLVNNEKEQSIKKMYDSLNSESYLTYKKYFGFLEKNNKNSKKIKQEENLNRRVHVAFITDENYAMPTTVAITSLKINRNNLTEYVIHIVTNNISEESKSKFLALEDQNFIIDIIPYNVEKTFSNLTKKDGDLHVSPSALIKLNLPEIFKNVGKILYLDGDVLIQDDLLELYNTDIKKQYAAVVKDIISERNPKHLRVMNIKHRYYFNSGMMLLNLTKCRKNNMTEKLIQYRMTGKNHFMDQDTLNYVFKENVKYVSYKYNYLNKFHDWWDGEKLSCFYGEMISDDKIQSFKDAVIIHLGSHEKPWKYEMGYLSTIYKEYYEKSPYNDIKLVLENLPEVSQSAFIKVSDNELLTPNSLVYRYNQTKNEKELLEKKYEELQNLLSEEELYVVNNNLEMRERDIENIKNSVSFKVGRAFTYIPRKIRSIFH